MKKNDTEHEEIQKAKIKVLKSKLDNLLEAIYLEEDFEKNIDMQRKYVIISMQIKAEKNFQASQKNKQIYHNTLEVETIHTTKRCC
ncbi:MAG: hypothetical protein QNK20_01110 [Aureibaculum sp.]|nr:hypothetical protein [Aureibaculum sp.]